MSISRTDVLSSQYRLIIHEVFGEKADVVNVGFDRFLDEARLLKPGPKILQEGLVIDTNGSHSCIMGVGLTHKTISLLCRKLPLVSHPTPRQLERDDFFEIVQGFEHFLQG